VDDELASRDLGADTLVSIGEGLDVLLISDNEALVQFGTRSTPSELFRDTGLNGLPGRVFGPLLSGPAPLAQLLTGIPDEELDDARNFVFNLLERGILTRSGTDPVEQYLTYTFTGESPLASVRVGLVGAGPIGARLAHSLLQHGIGHLAILDDRPVDTRWSAFLPLADRPADTAQLAHTLLSARLADAGHTGKVEALPYALDAEGLEALVADADIVVVALEQLSLTVGHLINRLCLRDEKPWMQATIDGNLGLVGPLFIPVQTACFNDYRVLADATTPNPEMARSYRRHVLARGAGSLFTGLPAYAEIVAGHASLALIQFLIRQSCFAIGRVMVIDFDRMTIDMEDVLKLPRCPVCGVEKSTYQPVFVAELTAERR